MAAMDHVSSPAASAMQQPAISSPMAPPTEFGHQERGQRNSTALEEPLGKQGEGGEGVGKQQQQQQEGQQEWEASSQPQVEGGEQKEVEEVFNPEEYWRVVSGNMVSALQEAVKDGQQGWQQLCGKEQLCLSRLQDLCKAAHSLNISFHNQRDSLHSTVLSMASSFKK
ncbi:uncharacterized protein LOC135093060 [Scylla paramamosain]|uniref:uncharacterized protein LOC135093060 n=1 Tax=Scylla paramamosain TaxID=85552 RepID=UPI0030830960